MTVTVRDILNVYILKDMPAEEKKLHAMVEIFSRYHEPQMAEDAVWSMSNDVFIKELPEICARLTEIVNNRHLPDLSKLNS